MGLSGRTWFERLVSDRVATYFFPVRGRIGETRRLEAGIRTVRDDVSGANTGQVLPSGKKGGIMTKHAYTAYYPPN
jgi:hypothetical protein